MVSATASWMEKNLAFGVQKRFPRPAHDRAYGEIMAGGKEASFGLLMANCVPVLLQALNL